MVQGGKRRVVCHGASHRGADGLYERRCSAGCAAGEECGTGASTGCDRGGARGSSREQAAKIGGMARQTLRDWVIRFNEQGPDGLVNKLSPGAPGKLTDEHKAFLTRLEGPIPAVDGVVR